MTTSSKLKNWLVCGLSVLLLGGLTLTAWFHPATDYSNSERRELKKAPTFTWESFTAGKFATSFEDYTLDQFPLRDNFRTLKARVNYDILRQLDNNNIYVSNGYAAKMEYPLDVDSLKHAAERFTNIYNKFLAGTDAKVYLSVVPDKSYFLAQKNGYLSLDYDKLFATMKENMPFADYIDITGTLDISDYYKTDTHWRQEKLEETARALAAGMGITLNGKYDVNTLPYPFYGVYYGQSALPLPAETMYYLTNDAMKQYIVTNYDTGKGVSMNLYDMEKAAGKDPYEMFLSGSVALLTIENPNATTDRELVIFRDSFGSSISPLLAEGYAKITVVDIRYLTPDVLGYFISFDNQDVLFLYSTLVLNESSQIK